MATPYRLTAALFLLLVEAHTRGYRIDLGAAIITKGITPFARGMQKNLLARYTIYNYTHQETYTQRTNMLRRLRHFQHTQSTGSNANRKAATFKILAVNLYGRRLLKH